jgi:hypothetical protein
LVKMNMRLTVHACQEETVPYNPLQVVTQYKQTPCNDHEKKH